ncbi:hypothetical protein, partial [Pseudomonas viridiflava]|uniref:hypothetical protein n=1 Tax=Pseudomonas viridiflava TaxID=33069 RepID=UPI001981F3D1
PTPRCAEHSRDVFGLRGFFAKEQPHDYRLRLPVVRAVGKNFEAAMGKFYLYGYTDKCSRGHI